MKMALRQALPFREWRFWAQERVAIFPVATKQPFVKWRRKSRHGGARRAGRRQWRQFRGHFQNGDEQPPFSKWLQGFLACVAIEKMAHKQGSPFFLWRMRDFQAEWSFNFW